MFDWKLLLRSSGADAVILTSPSNTLYASGYVSSFRTALLTKDGGYFLTDSRYFGEASEKVKGLNVVECSNQSLYSTLIELLQGAKRVAYDTDISLVEYLELTAKLASFELVPLGKELSLMRSVKSDMEIEKIRKALSISEKAFDMLLGFVREGVSERECAYTLEYYMMKLGGERISFDTIMAFGENTAYPHAHPTDKRLEKGMFVTCDFGAVVDGYHSDITRTFVFGKPTDKMLDVYNTVKDAGSLAMENIKDGVSARYVDSVAREHISKKGYGEYFTHSLGHGVGIDIHEEPRLASSSDTVLVTNNVVTVEPGIYIGGEFGVRIEEMVVVKDDGNERLNVSTRELIML